MKLTDKFEINDYNDFKKHKKECFDIIEDVVDLCFKETLDKNPTFLLNLDKMIVIKDLENNNLYTIPIENNKPLKVVFE